MGLWEGLQSVFTHGIESVLGNLQLPKPYFKLEVEKESGVTNSEKKITGNGGAYL